MDFSFFTYTTVAKPSMAHYVLNCTCALSFYGAENIGAIAFLWLVHDNACRNSYFGFTVLHTTLVESIIVDLVFS